MSEPELDLKRSLQVVRRRRILVSIFATLGLVAGTGYTVINPPMFASTTLVVLSPSVHDTRTQAMIANSDPVLVHALRSVDPRVPLQTLRGRIQVGSPAYNVISISAQGKSAAQAERTANAVASSYVDYVGSQSFPGGAVAQAQVLEPATDATAGSLAVRLLDTAGPGVLLGALLGAVVALAISRSDRRLRERGEIANSIGAPVLASISVSHPSDTSGWRRLLEAYEPGAVDAWRLRKALEYLDLTDGNGDASLAVLSLSSDRKALALGPQLAVFAASLGIPTTLVIGPPQDANATATLRATCSAPPTSWTRPKNLRVAVCDRGKVDLPPAALTVLVAVVDAKSPKVADTMRAASTVLGVSAGAVTAEELARLAANAAADGQHISGILVADPDPADHTTGGLPQLAALTQRRMPMRLTGVPTEATR